MVEARPASTSQVSDATAATQDVVELVARIQRGDIAAEEELVERFGRGVAIILSRHTRDPEVAEDLRQDVLANALVKLRRGELRDAKKLPGFLASMARNMAIEHYRKQTRRRTEADSETVDGAMDRGQSSQLGGLVRRENAALVRRMVGELSNVRDREILYRFYLADEDKDAIAADLELDSLQFNRVLHRARQRYKALFEDALRQQGLQQIVSLLWCLIMTLIERF